MSSDVQAKPKKDLSLLDLSISADTFAEHIREREPFCYLRYGDGEWIAIIGPFVVWKDEIAEKGIRQRHICSNINHHWTVALGTELGNILLDVASLSDNRRIYVGQHVSWYQEFIRPWLTSHGIEKSVRWVETLLLPGRNALRKFQTLRLLEAILDYPGWVVLVAKEDHRRFADAFGADHIPVPLRDAYDEIEEIVPLCEKYMGNQPPPIFLVSAGLAAEPIIWRLYKQYPSATYIDIGHFPDMLLGLPMRSCIRNNTGGIMDIIAEHYRPALGL